MVNLLLRKIKELEAELEKIKENDLKVREEILELFKHCKIEKSKKEIFKLKLLKTISKLEHKSIKDSFYDENNALKFESFVEIAKNVQNGYLVIVNADFDKNRQKFVLGFLINKISPFFTLQDNKIIGLLNEAQMKDIKNLKKVPYFNPETGEFDEIDIFKMIFLSEYYDLFKIVGAMKIFEEYKKRPSFRSKHYVEYSLDKRKVIDFEQEELDKQKKKYEFIYNEKYPNLEILLKREINNNNNILFVLALLERIDEEIEKIKESRGLCNIVNRMLNFIERKVNKEGIIEEVNFLRQRLIGKKIE